MNVENLFSERNEVFFRVAAEDRMVVIDQKPQSVVIDFIYNFHCLTAIVYEVGFFFSEFFDCDSFTVFFGFRKNDLVQNFAESLYCIVFEHSVGNSSRASASEDYRFCSQY